MPKAQSASLLSQFLGEMVHIYLQGFSSQTESEDGYTTMPLILQGIVCDFDKQFLLLSDETKTNFSLVNIGIIGKIDTVDNKLEEVGDRPKKESMN